MTNGEIWRDIPSLPGVLASNEGRIMLVPYRGAMPRGGQRPYGGTPAFGVWNKADGRFIVTIGDRTYKVARLVAEAFHGGPPFEGAVVMHLDENAANNRADNLRWGTQQENLNAPGFLDYCHSRTGDQHPAAKARARSRP
ncbi:MAG: HNH endonuclease [Alphaproteobacteria bacterium]|nr:HNH endonuclease [Alphaproteobacteria bacterium]MBM3601446.1 HNH endonuclease [Alphaproteobacteria bacterium]